MPTVENGGKEEVIVWILFIMAADPDDGRGRRQTGSRAGRKRKN